MIAWFVRNHVATNFLMLGILSAGIYAVLVMIPLEVFPSRELQQVNISVFQPAATPEDIEQSITNRIEQALIDLPYIDELRSRSSEQSAQVTVDLNDSIDRQVALNEIKARVDSLATLPQTADRPVVEIPKVESKVLNLVVSGDVDEMELALITRQIRDDIIHYPGISLAEVQGVRPFEIGIEIPPDTLRAYDLTLAQVAASIRAQSVDMSAGQLKTRGGEVLIRSQQQAFNYQDFASVVLRRFPDGSELKLGDIANVTDGFDENPIVTRFNGVPSANIEVFRVGVESAISVSDSVKAFLEENQQRYPDTISFGIWNDNSKAVKERLNTLLGSGWQGAILIAVLLTLFLHPSVAIWVVVGIPVCFAGALALLPHFGLTINLISLFGFILVLGVVVDDAIVTGENIYEHRRRGASGIDAAIGGTKEIARPVIFGVVTTMLAFVPLLMLPADTSFFGVNLAGVVIPVLAFSLIESKLILPNHLARLDLKSSGWFLRQQLQHAQDKADASLQWFIVRVYQPLVTAAVNARYVTTALFFAVLLIIKTLMAQGWVPQSFMPRVASDSATGQVAFPAGTPFEVTHAAVTRVERAADELKQKYTLGDRSAIQNILTTAGVSLGNTRASIAAGRSNVGSVRFEVDQAVLDEQGLTIGQLTNEWRQRVGAIAGVEKVTFTSRLFNPGSPVFVQLAGADVDQLQQVTTKIREQLATYNGVFDVEDTLQNGKRQLLIGLKPEAYLVGLTVQGLTEQVRSAFFGAQAQRIQRGRDDIRVMVRYPLDERQYLAQLDNLLITTPNGGEARFGDIATVSWSKTPSSIYHSNQLRTVNIEADVDESVVSGKIINEDLTLFLDELLLDYPNVSYSFDGEAKARSEFLVSFRYGIMGVLFAIFALLAIAFKSYYQPLIIMSVIPYSFVGAVIGHYVLGVGWSVFSYFGILALVGVVINDSLVLVDWINRRLESSEEPVKDVVLMAGKARFRAVILTSLTTFFGLMPILFQTSVGAQFLKPMAISLGCGILFATFLTLLLVPCNYMIWQDIRKIKRYLFGQGYDGLRL